MKIIDIIKNSTKPFASFEIVPPLKGSTPEKLYTSIRPLMEFEPPFINVTCHRDEIEYVQNKDKTYSKVTLSKRPGTVATIAAIMKEFPIEIVPHVICGGASRHKIESELLDLNFLDIENVVALRGDAIPGQKAFIPEEDGFSHSVDIVKMIQNLNQGIYLDQSVRDGVHTNFCVGVAGYPEKHYESPNLLEDIKHLKEKVDAGADYIVTQMFFSNQFYFDFVKKCREVGITVPIIPGLKPLSTLRQIETLPRAFHLDIPEEFMLELQKCKNNAEVYQTGIEWCSQQSKELLQSGVPAVHYYTMGRADNIRQIIRNAF